MATSKRQQIITKVKAALAAIKTTAGYKSNLGLNVFYYKDTDNNPVQSQELPAAIVRITERILETSSFATWDRSLEFDLTLIARTDDKAWELADDIEQAIRGNEQWDDLAEDTDASDNRNIDVHHGDKKYIAVSMTMRIQYVTDRHNADQ